MAERGASYWRKLFGLEKKPRLVPPPAHPGHSMTGKVVTGIAPDWSRYDNCMKVGVVGESHRQEALIRISKCPPSGEHGYECAVELVLEPDNPHDKFAVKVVIDGEHVGYLPRGTAKRFGPRLRGLKEQRRKAVCMAYVGRGPDHPNLGVNLRIPYDGEILQGKR
jgi:hypothetical protein